MKRQMWKIIQKCREEKINTRLDITSDEIVELYKQSSTYFEMICNAFAFGYAQGNKAEIKKKKI